MKSKIHEYQNRYLAMSKISKIILAIALTVIVTSCRETKKQSKDDHGHEHNADGSHMKETINQEEFQVDSDSMEIKSEEQSHDHDADGHHSKSDDSKTHKHDDSAEPHKH